MPSSLARHTALLLLSAASLGAQATTSNTAQVFVIPNFSDGSPAYNETVTQPGAISIAGSATGAHGSSGSAASYVDWGVIKLSGDSVSTLRSTAHGIFRDMLTITAPGVPTGSFGSISYSVQVDGAMAVGTGNAAQSTWSLRTDFGGGAYDLGADGSLRNNYFSPSGYMGDPFGSYTATTTFQFGMPAQLHVELTANAQTSYEGQATPATASFDLAHSLYWAGLSVSYGGVPLTNINVSSASGTDYLHSMVPVPEPASAALLLGGVLMLLALRRRTPR